MASMGVKYKVFKKITVNSCYWTKGGYPGLKLRKLTKNIAKQGQVMLVRITRD